MGAIACFFDEPWKRLNPSLSESSQAFLLNSAAFCLRALGRLTESLEPMRAGLPIEVRRADWKNACIRTINLSELELTLGDFATAVWDAEKSVAFADHSGDGFERMVTHTTLAHARHQAGQEAEAMQRFCEAEQMQVERQPHYPLLTSPAGFNYCELLLANTERAAWATFLECSLQRAPDVESLTSNRDALRGVEQRAAQTLKWADEFARTSLLTIALDHLALGRVALYRAALDGRARHAPSQRGGSESSGMADLTYARQEITAAVDGLRAASAQDVIPRGLLTRAWLRFMERDADGANADLDEAWQIAERGSMKLHMADIHLHRAGLFRDRAALNAAARLIDETGYHRRDEELADAREALGSLAE